LRDLSATDFADADILSMHLEIAALTDLREGQSARAEAERLDPECDAALADLLRIAPGITMGHPDVELLEARARAHARSRLPDTVAEGERRIAEGLAVDPLATPRTQEWGRRSAMAQPGGRMAEIRREFTRNAVVILASFADQLGNAATGYVATDVVVAAARFLLLHKDAIMATAPAWGQTGYVWAEYILIRSQQIIDEARRG